MNIHQKPIKERWPGKHTVRATVWFPDKETGKLDSRVHVECWVPEQVAALTVSLLALGNGLDDRLLRECQALADRIHTEGTMRNKVTDKRKP